MSRAARRAALAAAALALLAAACATDRPAPQATAEPAASAPDAAAPLATPGAELPETIVPGPWLLLPPVDKRGRRPFRADAVFARHLLDPEAPPPRAGDELTGETGEAQRWEERQPEPDGSVPGEFAWAYAVVTSPAPRVMLAELAGAGTLFVNGDGAAGDSYRVGYGLAPVALAAGENRLYVGGVRDGFRLVLRAPEHALLLELGDTTRPDLLADARPAGGPGRQGELAVTVINASLAPVARLAASTGDDAPGSLFPLLEAPADELPGLPPLAVVKLPLRFELREGAELPAAPGAVELPVTVGGHPDEPPRTERVRLELRAPGSARRITRRSAIDDSVQEYAVLPPAATLDDALPAKTGVVLTLHGAGVDELNQAASYGRHAGWWIVAPTNRRPFGFDWQDWGRLDAYETLEHALAWTGADAARVALTGHSMGGHGSWHLAVNDADRFVAVAPSAGWSSFDSYPGRPAGALAELWHAADGASDTPGLVANLVDTPVYVLHGDADDNVPASEGRALFEALVAAVAAARERGLPVIEPQLHIQPAASHWWDGDASPGVDCVDWPPVFALFDGRPRRPPFDPTAEGAPPAATRFEWTCVDPSIDRSHEWLSVIRPVEYGRPIHVDATWDPAARRVELTTDNAALIVLHWPDGQPPDSCSVDGDAITCGVDWGTGTRAARDIGDVLERHEDGWRVWSMDVLQVEALGWDPALKSPDRCGPFKRAFDRRFVLVYGTAGDAREDAELLARARYDSEVWRYRGNGRAEAWSDVDVLDAGNLPRLAGRNLILYGNRDTNLAFQALVPPDCPLRAERGRMALGEQVWEGDDLAAVCVYPRVGDPGALLGLFADTGPRGSRLGYTLAPFVSGVGCPDFALFDSAVLGQGDGGVRAAGWFDAHWREARQSPAPPP